MEAGTRKKIIDKPIVLKIFSKTCPDLTVVDLPGITKLPIMGSEMPDNIEEITTNLVVNYIKEKKTIILCVAQAGIDIGNSDALKLAKKYDPHFNRTLCALTKVDLADNKEQVRQTLQNRQYILKYGYIAVKNRGPKELKRGITIQEGFEIEQEYFQKHYPNCYQKGLVGINQLINKTCEILSKNI